MKKYIKFRKGLLTALLTLIITFAVAGGSSIAVSAAIAQSGTLTEAQVEAYINSNRVKIPAVLIMLDYEEKGENFIKQGWSKLDNYLYATGFDITVAEEDFYYYTALPEGFSSPMKSGRESDLEEFVTKFGNELYPDIRGKTVIIYESGKGEEGRQYGPDGSKGPLMGAPDGIFPVSGDPFGYNFSVWGLQAKEGEMILHGIGRRDEGLVAKALQSADVATQKERDWIKNNFFARYGTVEAVNENYLKAQGIAPNDDFLVSSFNAAGLKTYDYHMLSQKQRDEYNIWLMRRMRTEFDLLRYYYRFYNWSAVNVNPRRAADYGGYVRR